jgi:hypothetical protein
MKQFLIALVICCIATSAEGQSFFESGNSYYMKIVRQISGQTYYDGHVDTIFLDSVKGGTEYYSLQQEQQKKSIKVIGKKVWIYSSAQSWNCIYDFDLTAGDSMVVYETCLGDSVTIVVDSIDDRNVNGKKCLVQHVHARNSIRENYVFMEHYGSLDAGIEYWMKWCFEVGHQVVGICENNMALTWEWDMSRDPRMITFDSSGNCDTLYRFWERAQMKIQKKEIMGMYPSPATDMLHLVFQTAKWREIQICNSTGSLVLSTGSDQSTINISLKDISSGLYFLRTSDGVMAKFQKE